LLWLFRDVPKTLGLFFRNVISRCEDNKNILHHQIFLNILCAIQSSLQFKVVLSYIGNRHIQPFLGITHRVKLNGDKGLQIV
jgi:hypothetical protein